MNQKEKYRWEKEWLSKFDRQSLLIRQGSLNEVGSHGWPHETTVHRICYLLTRYQLKDGFRALELCGAKDPEGVINMFQKKIGKVKFYTEIKAVGEFSKGKEADILAMTYPQPTIIEVADTESVESIAIKRRYWEEKGFNFIEVRT